MIFSTEGPKAAACFLAISTSEESIWPFNRRPEGSCLLLGYFHIGGKHLAFIKQDGNDSIAPKTSVLDSHRCRL